MRALLLLLLISAISLLADDAKFDGRWDITVPHESRARAWWLEITGAGTPAMKGRFVGFPGGDMNDIPRLSIQNGELRFSFDNQDHRTNKAVHRDYSARYLAGDKLVGLMRSSDGEALKWEGVRAPVITEKDDGSWHDGTPMDLFNGKDVSGWHGLVPKLALGGALKDGTIANAHSANTVVFDGTFLN